LVFIGLSALIYYMLKLGRFFDTCIAEVHPRRRHGWRFA
jgi:hypothetical protein